MLTNELIHDYDICSWFIFIVVKILFNARTMYVFSMKRSKNNNEVGKKCCGK